MPFDSVETIIENSYKDFHAKGLDYICISRTPLRTRKVYFLNGDVTRVPEVVNPHDHRYDFTTRVLAGSMRDHVYGYHPKGDVYKKFSYSTPLNGGDGFAFEEEVRVTRLYSQTANRGELLARVSDEIHTIEMLRDQTILFLTQYADVVPVGVPTTTYVKTGYPEPNLSGLYSKFTADEVINRLSIIRGLL